MGIVQTVDGPRLPICSSLLHKQRQISQWTATSPLASEPIVPSEAPYSVVFLFKLIIKGRQHFDLFCQHLHSESCCCFLQALDL